MRKLDYLCDMKNDNEDDVQNAIDGLEIAVGSLRNYIDYGLKHDTFLFNAFEMTSEISDVLYEMVEKRACR